MMWCAPVVQVPAQVSAGKTAISSAGIANKEGVKYQQMPSLKSAVISVENADENSSILTLASAR
jgi:hypothetical protein